MEKKQAEHNREYSKWTLMPKTRSTRKKYLDYTRQQVREISPKFMIGITVLFLITLGFAFHFGEVTLKTYLDR